MRTELGWKNRICAMTLSVGLMLLPVSGPVAMAETTGAEADRNAEQTIENTIGNGNVLYSKLTITGSLMPEEQIYSVKELQTLEEESMLSLTGEVLRTRAGAAVRETGIDLGRFLTLCGVENPGEEDTVQFISETDETLSISCGTLIAGEKSALLQIPGIDVEEESGITVLIGSGEDVTAAGPVKKILVSRSSEPGDPYYGLHWQGPLQYMKDISFTVNYIDRSLYPEESGDAVPFRTVTYTMEELEQLMMEQGDQVSGNYFGISGNERSKKTMGLGGFFDYYEGIRLDYFLTEQCGLRNGEGFAVLYGRDQDSFGTIRNLSYFFPEKGDYTDYYLELSDEVSVSNVVPILAVSKNGAPLLPRHDHDMEGNVDYNTFNINASELGYTGKIGLVKNVSGPMIAGLSNLDGVYGGYQNETAGDCIRMDFYVDRSDYADLPDLSTTSFEDVSRDAWYGDAVYDLAKRNIVSGRSETVFDPDASVTRAEFVKMLAGGAGAELGSSLPSASMPFVDVDAEGWQVLYVQWAYEKGLVMGVDEQSFAPDRPVTRQEMAVILHRYLEQNHISLLEQEITDDEFNDKDRIADYAEDAVNRMHRYGIFNGDEEGNFRPEDSASRAETAQVISTFMHKLLYERT